MLFAVRRLAGLALVLAAAPPALAVRCSPARHVLAEDLEMWGRRIGEDYRFGVADGRLVWLSFLLLRLPEFRTLVYLRLRACGLGWRALAVLLALVYRPQAALSVDCDDVGPGLFFQHGFATIVSAERIGRDCLIGQQVTIGWGPGGRPVLEDGVAVRAGAIVVGGVRLGRGAHIGAGAVVSEDVPAHHLVTSPTPDVRRAT